MFYNCPNLPHYQEAGQSDPYRSYVFAKPDNGVSGYFTSKTPTVTLNVAEGSYGHFASSSGGGAITTITGALGSSTTLYFIPDSGYVVSLITDNTSKTYDIESDGGFTVNFNAEYIITAKTAVISPYAALTSSSDEKPNDTLMLRYDGLREQFEALGTTFDIGEGEFPT